MPGSGRDALEPRGHFGFHTQLPISAARRKHFTGLRVSSTTRTASDEVCVLLNTRQAVPFNRLDEILAHRGEASFVVHDSHHDDRESRLLWSLQDREDGPPPMPGIMTSSVMAAGLSCAPGQAFGRKMRFRRGASFTQGALISRGRRVIAMTRIAEWAERGVGRGSGGLDGASAVRRDIPDSEATYRESGTPAQLLVR